MVVKMDFVTRVILLLIALSGATAQTYRLCGGATCVGEATCLPGDRCECPAGLLGDARLACADPAYRCLCTILGDPHWTDFWGERFTLPLPCAHRIATLDIPDNVGDCKVVINGRAYYAHPTANQAEFEQKIHIHMTFDDMTFTAVFSGRKIPETKLVKAGTGEVPLNDYLSEGVSFSPVMDSGGFYIIDIQHCGFQAKYLPSKQAFSIQTPSETKDTNGMCGECNERWVNASTKLDAAEALKVTLSHLYPYSPVDGSNMNLYPECTYLYDEQQACAPARNIMAQEYCSKMLHGLARACIGPKLQGSEGVLRQFQTCYREVCTNNAARICNDQNDFFEGCMEPNVVNGFIASHPNFCGQLSSIR